MEKKMMVIAGLVTMVVVLNVCPANGRCDAEITEMLPCGSFIMGPAIGKPPPECCEGVKKVLDGANNEAKRRSLCQCLKDEAIGAGLRIIPGKLKNITGPCEIKLPIPKSPNVDCKKIPVF
ncbi:PREDICTED: non-specific lipid-transfer protein 1-like [Fragaria vesca subsp. vesca]|uniref:non-specific lipid-transfer protein 1-like n=1 Tax=Fragaria vesca subsp. vesca TaxID=101020 RepID=UPI0002C36E91|nr:PREDICTED: non-specific lipid-transfer protein 1-like [Fragaria vesca subsp. vesca]